MILLVRHGQTEWNLERRFQGSGDSPLTALGRAQAAANGTLLRDILGAAANGYRLISSPQGRAIETARVIGAALGMTPATDARLREVELGDWEGLVIQEVRERWGDLFDSAGPQEGFFRAPGGESYEALRDRVASFLEELASGPAILVSHGITSRLLRGLHLRLDRGAILNLPIPQNGVFRMRNGGVDFLETEVDAR